MVRPPVRLAGHRRPRAVPETLPLPGRRVAGRSVGRAVDRSPAPPSGPAASDVTAPEVTAPEVTALDVTTPEAPEAAAVETAAYEPAPELVAAHLEVPLGGPTAALTEAEREPVAPVDDAQRVGAIWLTLATVVAGAVNYAFAVVLTHRLAPGEYASFAATQQLLLLNGLIGSAGIPWVVARRIAQAGDDAVAVREAVTFGFWANVVAGLGIGVVAGGVSFAFADWHVAAELFVISFLLAVGSTGPAVLQGRGRTNAIAGIIVVEVLLKLGAGLALVAVFHTTAAALVGSLLGVLVLYAGYGGVIGNVGRPSLDRELLRSSLRLGKLQIAVGLMGSIDTVAVAILPVAKTVAASYQAAAALGRVPNFVSNAVSIAAYPSLVKPEKARAVRAESLTTYLTVGLFVIAALVTVPRSVLTLFFPGSYGDLKDLLPYTAALGVGLGALNVVSTFAQSRDRTRPTGWTLLAGLVLVVAGVVAGEHIGDAKGLCLGALLACWAAVVAILAERAERPALRLLMTRGNAARVLLVLAGAFAMEAAQGRFTWIAVGVVAGLVVLAAAFPELGVADRIAGRRSARPAAPEDD